MIKKEQKAIFVENCLKGKLEKKDITAISRLLRNGWKKLTKEQLANLPPLK